MQKSDTAFLYSVMNIGSKVVLFILCLLMSLLFRKQTPAHSLEYKFFDFIYTNHIHHHLCMPAASTSVSD